MTPPSRAISAFQALCRLELHAEVLIPAALEALHAVVPSHRNLFDWTDAEGRLVRYFIEGPIDAGIARLYFDEFHNRLEAEAMAPFGSLRHVPAGVRSADELAHEGFYRTALYNEIWRPQGLHTRLEAVLRDRAGALLGSLVLYRARGDADFRRDDEQRLALVLPALADALSATGPAQADDRHVPGIDAPQSLLLTLDGQLRHASPGAHRLLLMAHGGASRASIGEPLLHLAGELLPMLLRRLRERWQAGPAGALAPPPSIVHETAAGQFVASGALMPAAMGSADAGQANHVGNAAPPLALITLRRLEPHRVALARALRRLPVTPGQAEVARLLYHGRSQAEIGASLGVATATVVDHIRKLYRALDLRSALELRARLDAMLPP